MAKLYCKDDPSRIENYEQAISDQTQVWDIHHRREATCSLKELVKNGEYFHRPAAELIFLTHGEHTKLHKSGENNPLFGRRGENNPRFGKHLSDETRAKISAAKRGMHHTAESRAKLSAANSGENHPNFGKHLSAETRAKISATMRERRLKRRSTPAQP